MIENKKGQELTRRLDGIREILMAHHHAGSLLPPSTKGSEREFLVREFLSRVFPPPFRFGTGQVIDGAGATSGQLDIVVEFPFFPSFPTPGAAERLYLAESVSFAMEVKSNLADQWKQVEDSAERFLPLRRSWRSHLGFNEQGVLEPGGSSSSRIPFVAVGYTGYKTSESLERRLKETPPERRPDAALVIDSGAYVGFLTDVRSDGAQGLLALCAEAAYFATNVLIAHADFRPYLKSASVGNH